MKSWYILIHFEGSYVSGFLVFDQPDEESARKALLSKLIGKKIMLRALISLDHDLSYKITEFERIKSFIRSVSNPWRHTKEKFAHPQDDMIRIIDMKNEVVDAGYWLKDVLTDTNYCNIGRRCKSVSTD